MILVLNWLLIKLILIIFGIYIKKEPVDANNRLFLILYNYMHNAAHCSGNNVCHHQKVKLMLVLVYIFNIF